MTTVKAVKRAIVVTLEATCGFIDNWVPRVWREGSRWHVTRHGCWGCWPLRLAERSERLDQRWGTGVWT